MKLILLISALGVVCGRPQSRGGNGDNDSTRQVEIERQEVIELHPSGRSQFKSTDGTEIDKITQDILQKIDEVNKQHGYAPRKIDLNYKNIDIPHFYALTDDEPKPDAYNSQFLNDPMNNNPINSYSQQQIYDNKFNDIRYQPRQHPVTSEDSDVVPGQFVTRKITHKESYLVPSRFLPIVNSYEIFQPSLYGYVGDNVKSNLQNSNKLGNIQNTLEKQTIESVKNIIVNSQLPPNIQETRVFNPLVQTVPYNNPYVQYPAYSNPSEYYNNLGYVNNIREMPWNAYKSNHPGRQIQSDDVASIAKNPNVMLYNAVTTLIEYGHSNEACVSAEEHRNGKKLNESDLKHTPGVLFKFGVGERDKGIEIELFKENDTNAAKDREEKELREKTKKVIKPQQEKSINNPVQLIIHAPQVRQQLNPDLNDQEVELDDLSTTEMEKDAPPQETDKKIFSKDNMGPGIFIQKLKVRKGGVAIAGPGGIATAGSGGTAIVGPNGVAYTHPDSWAIAGNGSKVIAVDPSISLKDVIKQNGTNDGGMTRIGKLVAVGPVIYYNRG